MQPRRALIAVSPAALAVSLAALPARAPAPASDTRAPLAFLAGAWDAGANTGARGTGTGSTTFERSLQGRVLVRTNHAEYPAAGDRPATTHDDLMVIYAAAGGALEADYYDNEGHKIHYAITVPAAGRAVFLGDVPAAGPRFRLTYVKRDDKIVDGQFEMAAPGHPDEFQKYLAWEMRRAEPASRP